MFTLEYYGGTRGQFQSYRHAVNAAASYSGKELEWVFTPEFLVWESVGDGWMIYAPREKGK